MKKVLIISPTPTHPANAGNRAHIFSLVSFLRSRGLEIHFLYLAYESFDKEAMKAYWGDKLYIIEREKLYWPGPWFIRGMRGLYFRAYRLKRWTQKLTGRISDLQYRYNSELDIHFPAAVGSFIRQLQLREKFDIVNCEYVFMSRALTYFAPPVFKILDTHDSFTDRFKVYLESNLTPAWVSLYKDQEQKALDRADLVIALQENERAYFKKLSNAEVIRYSYIPDFQPCQKKDFEKKLLYFASDSVINHKALSWFIGTCWSAILERHPSASLLIGGSICRTFVSDHLNIVLKGQFDRPEDFYKLGDVAINPEQKGTGFKIKALEALAFGLPLVSTGAGAAGVTEPFMDHVLVADDAVSFTGEINRLLEDGTLRVSLGENATKWIAQYKTTLTQTLLQHLPQ